MGPLSSNEASVQGTPEGVEDSGWLTRVAAFPIGIQPERFVEALERPDVKRHITGLLTRYAGRKASRSPIRVPWKEMLPPSFKKSAQCHGLVSQPGMDYAISWCFQFLLLWVKVELSKDWVG